MRGLWCTFALYFLGFVKSVVTGCYLSPMEAEDSLVLEDDISVVTNTDGKCIAGKILAPKKLNVTGVNNILINSWPTKVNFKISNLGDNIFTVIFELKGDAKKLLEEGPWSVIGYTVVTQEWDIKKPIGEVCFEYCYFWLLIHNLPVARRSSINVMKIAELAGRVIEIEKRL